MQSAQSLPIIFGLIAIGASAAQLIAYWTRLPSILPLLVIGIILGPLTGLINIEQSFGDALFPIVSLCVGMILFEGGVSLDIRHLPQIQKPLIRLLSIGVVVTWTLSTLAAWALTSLTFEMSVLIGAIVSVSGPTVVGPLLRLIRARGTGATLAHWEGILVDPTGALLALLVFETLEAYKIAGFENYFVGTVLAPLRTILIGVVLGLGVGKIIAKSLREYWIPDQLQIPLTVLSAIVVYISSNLVQPESGLLSITFLGMYLSNERTVHTLHIEEFFDNLRILLISFLFIVLAARIRPEDLWAFSVSDFIFVAVLIVVVRPIAVWASIGSSDYPRADKLFLAAIAPRGIVAAAIASVFSFRMGEESAHLMPLVFLVVSSTVVVYSIITPLLAKKLKLSGDLVGGMLIVGANKFARELALVLKELEFKVLVVDTVRDNIHEARLLGLRTHYLPTFSPVSLEQIDLSGIEKLLCLSANDETNSLAAIHFSHNLGRKNIYQLPATKEGVENLPPLHLRGREAFSRHYTLLKFLELLGAGAVIKHTPLTKEFDLTHYQKLYGQRAIPLAARVSKRLSMISSDSLKIPSSADLIISLILAEDLANVDSQQIENEN